MIPKKRSATISALMGKLSCFAHAAFSCLLSGTLLSACATKQLSFDDEAASAPPRLQRPKATTRSSGSGKKVALNALNRRGLRSGSVAPRPLNVTVRNEINDEMTSLERLEIARAKLRTEYRDQPLLGPITIQHLDDILIAEFDANRLQAQYLANNIEQSRRQKTLIENELTPTHERHTNNQQSELPSAVISELVVASTGMPESSSNSNSLNGYGTHVTANLDKSDSSSGVRVESTTMPKGDPIQLPAKVDQSHSILLAETSSRSGASLRKPATLGDAARLNEAAMTHERVINQTPPKTQASSAGVFVETHTEDGNEPARKMAARVLHAGSLEPGLISDTPPLGVASLDEPPAMLLKKLNTLEDRGVELSQANETPLIFDIPMTYNARVSFWIRYFQTEGRSSFRGWLERSSKFIPLIQYELTRAGLPQDLVYVAMIESGFSSSASSHAAAIGLWQFIEPTGKRYGLKIDWWLDERRDFIKSTRAAINYMGDLYHQFNSWYLVAASYNMGENGVRRLMSRYKTNNFWELADRGAMPNETTNYVPKIIAATLIAKAPALYGFRDLNYQMPVAFEYFNAPGGTDISNLAQYLGVSGKYLKDLNPELTKGFVPRGVSAHRIRIPKGAMLTVSQYVKLQAGEDVSF